MTEPALENVVPGEAAEGRRGWPRRRGRLRGDLRASTIDGAAFSVMVGVGEWYMPLFVLAAGLGQVLSGLVVTLPSLIGAVLQLASPWGARVMGGVREWTVLSAAVQAAAWAPLAVGAAVGWIPAWLVLASMVLYQAGGLAAGATWTTWIGQLVPSRIRSRYFGRRAWWCHMGTVGGVVAGGLILEAGVGTSGHTGPSARALAEGIVWFAALFAIAGVMRGVSAYYLWRQTGMGPVHGVHVHVAPTDLLRRLRRGRDGRLIASMMLMMGGAMVANAFFPAFLKDALGFSYAQIMALLATSVLAKAFTQPLWGEVAHRGGGAGADRVLLLGGLLVVPLPALWLVAGSMPSGGFWWMLATQVLAGAA